MLVEVFQLRGIDGEGLMAYLSFKHGGLNLQLQNKETVQGRNTTSTGQFPPTDTQHRGLSNVSAVIPTPRARRFRDQRGKTMLL